MQYGTERLTVTETKDKKKRKRFDTTFFVLVLLLLLTGVISVLSASYPRAYYDPSNVTGGSPTYYFVRQLVFAVLGIAAMLLCSRLPMGFYRRF